MEKFEAVIERVTRLGMSTNGNPTYRVHLRGGHTLRTQSDAAINYGINNLEYLGVPVLIDTSAAGRITHVTIKPVSGEK